MNVIDQLSEQEKRYLIKCAIWTGVIMWGIAGALWLS